jgi:hypothetical protein
VSPELRDLIRRMSRENPLWGAPRIHGELLKLGFEIAESTVSKYIVRRRRPPSQTWRTFLHNHADAIAGIDLCVVPTLTFEFLSTLFQEFIGWPLSYSLESEECRDERGLFIAGWLRIAFLRRAKVPLKT